MSKRTINQRNRKNAQRSTGPITPAGKARSAQNSLSHGMYAKNACLPHEDLESYLQHQQGIEADLKPEGAIQQELALQISDNCWRMRRLRLLEKLHTSHHIKEQFQILADLQALEEQQTASLPASGFVPTPPDLPPPSPAKSPTHQALETLGRHIQRVENGTNKAVRLFFELQLRIRQAGESSSSLELQIREKVLHEIAVEREVLRYHSEDPFSPYWSGEGMPPPNPAFIPKTEASL